MVGIGFFSDVYRGTWRGRTVAIKVLAESTPRDLFKHEVAIWARLQHPHVLKLYGASSAAGDPPWFFVAPYMRNESLVQYLKGVEAGWSAGTSTGGTGGGGGSGSGKSSVGSVPVPVPAARGGTATFPVWGSPSGSPGHGQVLEGRRGRAGAGESGAVVPREWDLYRFMHEIAKGMEYLHANGVLHGDLKVRSFFPYLFINHKWMVGWLIKIKLVMHRRRMCWWTTSFIV